MERTHSIASINAQIEAHLAIGADPAAVFSPMVRLLCECVPGSDERREEFLIYLEELRRFTWEVVRSRVRSAHANGDWSSIAPLMLDAIFAWRCRRRLRYAVRQHSRTGENQSEFVRDILLQMTLRIPLCLVKCPAH